MLPAYAGPRGTSFAVLSDVPNDADQLSHAKTLLDWIDTHGDVQFAVHLGNLKSKSETCSDTLYTDRFDLLNALNTPVVYIPGQADWIDCAPRQPGSADPLERLDTLRDIFLHSATSLGRQPIRMIRESELAAFRPYRENTRWLAADIAFVTLQVPSDNNHFEDGGGRNGEYEDREIANRAWINRAVSDARRRQAKGIVFFFQGDLYASRKTSRGLSWWFRGQRRERDGFATLRRDFAVAARNFDGPIWLIHGSHHRLNGRRATSEEWLSASQVRDSSGKDIRHLQQITVGASASLQQWVRIAILPPKSSNDIPRILASVETLPNDAAVIIARERPSAGASVERASDTHTTLPMDHPHGPGSVDLQNGNRSEPLHFGDASPVITVPGFVNPVTGPYPVAPSENDLTNGADGVSDSAGSWH